MSSTEGLTQRKGKKGNQNAAKAPSADKEDKHKPIRASASLFPLDPITEKNLVRDGICIVASTRCLRASGGWSGQDL